MKHCEKCDKSVSENFKHCPECGSKLSDIEKNVDKPEDSRKTIEFDLFAKKTIFSIIIVMAAVMALAVVIAKPGYITGLLSLLGSTTTTISATTSTTITSATTNPTVTTSISTSTTSTTKSTTTSIPYIDVSVKAINDYTNEPITGADVYLDGSIAGKTGQDGTCIIKNVLKGSHNLEIIYNNEYSSSKMQKDFTYSVNNVDVRIKAPVDVMLTVKDTETNNLVKATKISLEDRNDKTMVTQTTTDQGTVLIKDIMPGEYRLSVHIPIEQGQEVVEPSQYGKIGFEKQITIVVDMPNPNLFISVDTSQNWIHTEFYCDITITNNGNFVSKVPMAVCLLYEKDKINNTKQPSLVNSGTALFRDIAGNGGSEKERATISKSPNPLTEQSVVVVVYDSNSYGPDKRQEISMQTSENFGARVISDAYSYCTGQPDKCLKIGATVATEAVKLWFTGGA